MLTKNIYVIAGLLATISIAAAPTLAFAAMPQKLSVTYSGTGSVTCPNGLSYAGATISASAASKISTSKVNTTTTSGTWQISQSNSTASLAKSGSITGLSFTNTSFILIGPVKSDNCGGAGAPPVTVTIVGNCSAASVVTFTSTDGEKGTFQGNAVCKTK